MRSMNQMEDLLTRDNPLGWAGFLVLAGGIALAVLAHKLAGEREWLCRLFQGVGVAAAIAGVAFLIRVM